MLGGRWDLYRLVFHLSSFCATVKFNRDFRAICIQLGSERREVAVDSLTAATSWFPEREAGSKTEEKKTQDVEFPCRLWLFQQDKYSPFGPCTLGLGSNDNKEMQKTSKDRNRRNRTERMTGRMSSSR